VFLLLFVHTFAFSHALLSIPQDLLAHMNERLYGDVVLITSDDHVLSAHKVSYDLHKKGQTYLQVET
jgi:ABC-type Mn2+/Zn2+ transport system permease subunit